MDSITFDWQVSPSITMLPCPALDEVGSLRPAFYGEEPNNSDRAQ